MRRNQIILIILNVLSLLAVTIMYVYLGLTYSSIFAILVGLLNVIWVLYSANLLEKYYQLGERLFIQSFGVNPDKSEMIQRPLGEYDRLEVGTSGKAIQMKFWLEGEVHKGIIDVQNSVLYMKSPVPLPVYAGISIPVWKETTEMHGNGMSKKVEFYDSQELPHRVDFLDEKGNLTKGSWRRHEGVEKYWNSRKQIWESIP